MKLFLSYSEDTQNISLGDLSIQTDSVVDLNIRVNKGENVDDIIVKSDVNSALESGTINGGEGNDLLISDNDNDTLIGGVGNDTIFGNSGNDLINGQAGDDFIYGGSGNDMMFGGSGDDALLGQSGDDKIHGDAGNDLINGGSGNDAISSGLGSDTIIGGNGSDTFVSRRSNPGDVDTLDFLDTDGATDTFLFSDDGHNAFNNTTFIHGFTPGEDRVILTDSNHGNITSYQLQNMDCRFNQSVLRVNGESGSSYIFFEGVNAADVESSLTFNDNVV